MGLGIFGEKIIICGKALETAVDLAEAPFQSSTQFY
jgi:hypothetical protein